MSDEQVTDAPVSDHGVTRHVPRTAVDLGPDAIVEWEFGRGLRGYDQREVDDLLDRLATQTGELVEEVGGLRAERERLLTALEETSEAESTLKRTLVTAQRAAEISVEEAQGHADAIRARALTRAHELLARAAERAHEMREASLRRARADEAEARRRRRALDEHVATLRAFAEDHRDRVAHHLRQQLERLDAIELPAPPPEPERTPVDDVTDEPVLEHGVEEMVADIADEVGAPSPGDGRAPDEEADRGTGEPSAEGGAAVVGDDLDEMLARVDEAAADVEQAAGADDDDAPDDDADDGGSDDDVTSDDDHADDGRDQR